MCWGPCSSTLRSRNSSGGRPWNRRPPWPAFRSRAGTSASPSTARARTTCLRATPVRPGQRPKPTHPAPRSIASWSPTDGWTRAASPDRRRRDPQSPPRVGHHRPQRDPAQAEADQPVEQDRLEQVVGPDVPGPGHQDQRDRDHPDPRPGLRPGRPGEPVESQASRGEGQGVKAARAAESPMSRLVDVEQRQRAAMGVEGVERPDERVVGDRGRGPAGAGGAGGDTPGPPRGSDSPGKSGRARRSGGRPAIASGAGYGMNSIIRRRLPAARPWRPGGVCRGRRDRSTSVAGPALAERFAGGLDRLGDLGVDALRRRPPARDRTSIAAGMSGRPS